MSYPLSVPTFSSCTPFPAITFQCYRGNENLRQHKAISQNWFKILWWYMQNQEVGKGGTGSGKSLPQTGVSTQGTEDGHQLALLNPSLLHLLPLLGCPWERAVLPLSSPWGQGHWLECFPTHLAELLVPEASLLPNAVIRSCITAVGLALLSSGDIS